MEMLLGKGKDSAPSKPAACHPRARSQMKRASLATLGTGSASQEAPDLHLSELAVTASTALGSGSAALDLHLSETTSAPSQESPSGPGDFMDVLVGTKAGTASAPSNPTPKPKPLTGLKSGEGFGSVTHRPLTRSQSSSTLDVQKGRS